MSAHTKPNLWPHQARCVELARNHRDFAFFMDLGTGKTAMMVRVLEEHYLKCSSREGYPLPVNTLILCPKQVVHQWKPTFVKFSEIPDRFIFPVVGSKDQCLKVLDIPVAKEHPAVFIINYEKLLSKDVFQRLIDFHPKIIVCDESHLLKSHNSQRSVLVEKLADRAERRFLLTGTPILQSALDIFQQYRVLDGGETFGQNFYAFRGEYFEDANRHWAHKPGHFAKWVPRSKTYDRLNALIYRKAIRMTKEQCLDLPPLVRQTIEVELSSEQKRAYCDMKRDLVAYVATKNGEDRAVVARTAVTKALRLQQIVTGHAKDDQENIVHLDASPRMNALSELLETITPEHKVIVWAAFIDNYRAVSELCDKLSIKHVAIHGQISDKDREEAKSLFKNDKDVRVIIANQKAAGTGLDGLQIASYAIYFSKSFSLGDDIQSMGRNHRGGSEIHEKVTRIDIVAKDTIDEMVNASLENKEEIAERILAIVENL